MWTLKDEYRDLIDAKLNAATKEKAEEQLLESWDKFAYDGDYEVQKPSLTLKVLKPEQYLLERRIWDNAYKGVHTPYRYLPKEELLDLLQEAITER